MPIIDESMSTRPGLKLNSTLKTSPSPKKSSAPVWRDTRSSLLRKAASSGDVSASPLFAAGRPATPPPPASLLRRQLSDGDQGRACLSASPRRCRAVAPSRPDDGHCSPRKSVDSRMDQRSSSSSRLTSSSSPSKRSSSSSSSGATTRAQPWR